MQKTGKSAKSDLAIQGKSNLACKCHQPKGLGFIIFGIISDQEK